MARLRRTPDVPVVPSFTVLDSLIEEVGNLRLALEALRQLDLRRVSESIAVGAVSTELTAGVVLAGAG